MVNTAVTLCGLPLENPVIPASGTFGYGYEFAQIYDINCLGTFSFKGTTLTPRYGNPTPRIAEYAGGLLNSVGLQNPGVEAVIREELPRLREVFHKPVMANISGFSIEEYAQVCRQLDGEEQVGWLEVNISCPNVHGGGAAFGADPRTAAAVTRAVRDVTKKPVIMKLSPAAADIAAVARACQEAGADGVSLINTLPGMRIDLKRRRPLLANGTGGMSGPGIFPLAVRMVYQVYEAVDIPIVGMGGVSTAEDVLELMLAGATAEGLAFGGRTTRGYGRMTAEVCKKVFRFPTDLDAWLAFDPDAADAFADADAVAGRETVPQENILCVELRMTGSFIVRRYTSDVAVDEDKSGPDYCALENGNGRPVLPGTGWAGAFRHHMRAMLDEMGGTAQQKADVNALFGYSDDGVLKKRSALAFDETEISGGQAYTLTRNALDRFTAGTASKALYTSCVQQGGQGTLTIRLRRGALDVFQWQLLGAALLDLDRGYLTVGGENSVGRGRATITALTLNGYPLQKEDLLHALAEVEK